MRALSPPPEEITGPMLPRRQVDELMSLAEASDTSLQPTPQVPIVVRGARAIPLDDGHEAPQHRFADAAVDDELHIDEPLDDEGLRICSAEERARSLEALADRLDALEPFEEACDDTPLSLGAVDEVERRLEQLELLVHAALAAHDSMERRRIDA
jgi:hypothetical protein